MNNKYEVYVGNIGMVYDGDKLGEAIEKYKSYVKYSQAYYGRTSQESVVLMRNNEILIEYPGTLENTDI